MATYDITLTDAPEVDPSATTGDAQLPAQVTVEWNRRPSEDEIRRFEDQYPPHMYAAFHYVEGVGKVHETA